MLTITTRVAVAGVGLVTPLGLGAWATFASLSKGRRITDRLANLLPEAPVMDIVRGVGGVSSVRHLPVDPLVGLAEQTAREATTEAGVEPMGMPTWLGCSKGAVHAWLAKDALAVGMGPHGYVSHHLQRRLGVEVWSHHVAACASGLIALDAARQAIMHGRCCEALVVSAEAALHPLFVHSYERLGVLSPLTLEGYVERPMHRERGGFVLAEAGAAVVLRAVDADDEPAGPWLELVDTATACEAHDLIRPSPQMPALGRVASTLFKGRSIACVHPHAPGTLEHDARELAVLSEALRDAHAGEAGVYAVKGALGHTLGSAGLVALVVASLCARAARTPGMPWLDEPMQSEGWSLSREALTLEKTGHHAVFAAGFGGHTAGAVVRWHR